MFTGLLGLLVAVAVPADSPPWEIWNDLNRLAVQTGPDLDRA